MLPYHLVKYKSDFEIDFLFVVHLSKQQNIKKKITIKGNVIRPTPLQKGNTGSNLHCALTKFTRSSTKIHPQSPKI